MKRLLIILIICCSSLIQSSCERDDLCAETTPVTPLLIIRFFDADNPTTLKAPNNLAIIALESSQPTEPFLTTSSDSIAIPLRTNANLTSFSFTLNSDENDTEQENIDVLSFSYTTEEEFVSEACGFRVIYEDLQNGNAPQDDGPWIQNIDIENTTVNDQIEAHISIFH